MSDKPFEYALDDYPLAPATLYHVGGPARLALLPPNADEAVAAYTWMMGRPEPHLILGKGSNVLISDDGFDGIVFFTGGLERIEALGEGRYSVEGGAGLERFVRDVIVECNYEGAGALTGIPGSVGGAIYMNAGTANGSTCQFLESIDLATPAGLRTITMEPGLYGYRGQSFCTKDDLILRGLFAFTVSEADQRAVYEHYLKRRREKQPWGHCCGSVFKNPENDHAGRLIEACGLKGARRGGAVISERHANFIMNENGATFEDVMGLILLCEERVAERFGVRLQREVVVVR